MFEHLVNFDPAVGDLSEAVPLDKATTPQLLSAQYETAKWLEEVGAPTTESTDAKLAAVQAQQTFSALTTHTPDAKQKAAVVALKTPAAVRHLTGMLTAYDWEFVEQAREIRGYVVAQIMEETKHPDAKIRLRALEMLGKVTEVALFTDRVEVRKTEMTDTDLDTRIKEKLNRFMGVVDATPTDIRSAVT